LTEINFYDAENDEINVQDIYQWQAETDEFLRMSDSNTLEEIRFDRGWTRATLDEELFKRKAVLAYLIDNGLNTYTQVAATIQAFINDEETILALMANDQLERSLEDLREMESVLIDIDPEKEAMVPRPDPNEEELAKCEDILDRAESELFEEYHGQDVTSVNSALADVDAVEPDVTPEAASTPSSGTDGDAVETSADGAGDPDEDEDMDGFGISFEADDGAASEGAVDSGAADPDPDSGTGDADPDAADADSMSDIDEWGFGDVTDTDSEET
ncbi:MAG: secretion system protein E, partial [Haloplanus sp.]